MPELGAKGLAKVLALKPCPEIQAGPGHVVLSTFAHPATHEILDVTIGQGEDAETIGVTETHPFWSVQDQAFVSVGHLVAGSQVLTADDQTKTITSILPRPGPAQQVYNLEVNGEHVYYVGQQQLLVHNECGIAKVYLTNDKQHLLVEVITSSGTKRATHFLFDHQSPSGLARAFGSEDAYSVIKNISPDNVITIPLKDATAALARQQKLIDDGLSIFEKPGNSCLSHVLEVLKAGGVSGTEALPNTLKSGFWHALKGLAN